ncbi:protein rep [Halobacillus litoralis]|uniref:protein rep n=1 Tax=Halobacillus litoralis TaxID=45668 RepID=UPI001CD229FA|nr:protein rep [Halobacillus litoralis]MCA1024448.1 protein rep [Halobacillus litoralis]
MCSNNSIDSLVQSTGDLLVDKNCLGKKRDWKGKKQRSQLTAEHFEKAGLKSKAERMHECADMLVFKKTPDSLKLYQSWFCKVRLCPMCNWRRSLKIAYHNKKIVETVNDRENVRWLFLTLTVRNTDAENLSESVSSMFKAFNKLTKYKAFKTSVRGYFRALEVTKNRDLSSKSFGTYHPHFHVLLCVPASYFKKKEFYIKHDEWTRLWQRAMNLDYKPIVNVKKVKPKDTLDSVEIYEEDFKKAIKEQNAVLEVSKYPVKDTDVIQGDEVTDENIETVLSLDSALSYKRLIGYGGLLKEIHKELNLSDEEDGDLIHISEEDEISNGTFDVIARWHIGIQNYVIQ